MSRHIAAHRLADLSLGKHWKGAPRAREHLASCADCNLRLGRIRAGQKAMGLVRETPKIVLPWDHIGARIYWATSLLRRQEQRLAGPSSERIPWRWSWSRWMMSATAIVVVCGLFSVFWPGDATNEVLQTPVHEGESLAAIAPTVPEGMIEATTSLVEVQPQQLAGLITFFKGDVRVGGLPLDKDSLITVGARLQTQEGSVVVQFDSNSAFRLRAHSELTVRKFDARAVELDVRGLVDVDITHRPKGQRFVVRAGESEVIVRGTAFRVGYQDSNLEVSCLRGKVTVADTQTAKKGDGDNSQIGVPAGYEIGDAQASLGPVVPRRLSNKRLAKLHEEMRMPMLPAWITAADSLAMTTVLDIEAHGSGLVVVDGVLVDVGPLSLRTMKGRHHVALVDSKGRESNGQWLDVAKKPYLAIELRAQKRGREKPQDHAYASAERHGQFQEALKEPEAEQRIDRCLKPLRKQGLVAGAEIVFDVGIAPDGSQGHLNIVQANVSLPLQECIRSALDEIQLSGGDAARFQHRLSF